jgi:hypothetical protein
MCRREVEIRIYPIRDIGWGCGVDLVFLRMGTGGGLRMNL